MRMAADGPTISPGEKWNIKRENLTARRAQGIRTVTRRLRESRLGRDFILPAARLPKPTQRSQDARMMPRVSSFPEK
jgi:hypothetical protein